MARPSRRLRALRDGSRSEALTALRALLVERLLAAESTMDVCRLSAALRGVLADLERAEGPQELSPTERLRQALEGAAHD